MRPPSRVRHPRSRARLQQGRGRAGGRPPRPPTAPDAASSGSTADAGVRPPCPWGSRARVRGAGDQPRGGPRGRPRARAGPSAVHEFLGPRPASSSTTCRTRGPELEGGVGDRRPGPARTPRARPRRPAAPGMPCRKPSAKPGQSVLWPRVRPSLEDDRVHRAHGPPPGATARRGARRRSACKGCVTLTPREAVGRAAPRAQAPTSAGARSERVEVVELVTCSGSRARRASSLVQRGAQRLVDARSRRGRCGGRCPLGRGSSSLLCSNRYVTSTAGPPNTRIHSAGRRGPLPIPPVAAIRTGPAGRSSTSPRASSPTAGTRAPASTRSPLARGRRSG